MTHSLSKSRFVTGWQCPKLLWWQVHEPDAKQLQPGIVLQDLFDQGKLVDLRARTEWPDGVLVDRAGSDAARTARTQAAIDSGARVIFGAAFEAAGAYCIVDVLERNDDGWTLIEVKSASSVKEYHLPDVAVQVHVARRAGLSVTRAEVMHLNREHRHPDTGPLFARTDVSAEVSDLLPEVEARIPALLHALTGPLPDHPVGKHCWLHDECAFFDRCWPDDPDHIRFLWNTKTRSLDWMQRGIHTMSAIPADAKLNDKQKRQLRAQREGRLIVERGLAAALAPAARAKRLGFLDFETIQRALPSWDGLAPWHQIPAQFSYHERAPEGTMSHVDFLAEGPANPDDPPDDPREPIARAMLDATANADVIVVYSSFEASRIKDLAAHLPHLAEPLLALREKLWDLMPVVSENVYHPDFRGSFSLKTILNPLVPDLSYDDLFIVDGKIASVEIARLLFVSGRIPAAQRAKTRHDLLEYCKRDTFATVRLVHRLAELATAPTG